MGILPVYTITISFARVGWILLTFPNPSNFWTLNLLCQNSLTFECKKVKWILWEKLSFLLMFTKIEKMQFKLQFRSEIKVISCLWKSTKQLLLQNDKNINFENSGKLIAASSRHYRHGSLYFRKHNFVILHDNHIHSSWGGGNVW